MCERQEQPDIALAEILAAHEEQEKPIESDPGTDKVTVYTIENFELSQIEDSMIGQFFSGDSYVIQYEYELRGRKQATLFFGLVTIAPRMRRALQPCKQRILTTPNLEEVPLRFVLYR